MKIKLLFYESVRKKLKKLFRSQPISHIQESLEVKGSHVCYAAFPNCKWSIKPQEILFRIRVQMFETKLQVNMTINMNSKLRGCFTH